MSATPTKASEALAELEHLLEPVLWITDLHWDGGYIGVATVTGHAKMLGWAIDGLLGTAVGEHPPDEIRAAMFDSAQKAIRAVEEAGFRHAGHPVFTIDGTAQRENELTILRTSGVLKLTLRPPKKEKAAAGEH